MLRNACCIAILLLLVQSTQTPIQFLLSILVHFCMYCSCVSWMRMRVQSNLMFQLLYQPLHPPLPPLAQPKSNRIKQNDKPNFTIALLAKSNYNNVHVYVLQTMHKSYRIYILFYFLGVHVYKMYINNSKYIIDPTIKTVWQWKWLQKRIDYKYTIVCPTYETRSTSPKTPPPPPPTKPPSSTARTTTTRTTSPGFQ